MTLHDFFICKNTSFFFLGGEKKEILKNEKKDKNVLDKPNLVKVLEVGGVGGGGSFVFRGTFVIGQKQINPLW